MLIVLPSDPATKAASETLNALKIAHQVIIIPLSLGYKTDADTALYIPPDYPDKAALMTTLSTKGHVIMRVFKAFTFEPEKTP